MSNFSSASPLLLFKSKSFRRHRDSSGSPTRTLGLPDSVEGGGGAGASGASGGGPGGDSSLSSDNNSPHRLRRVFTTHACRRRPTEAKSLGGPIPPGHASPIQFRRMTSLMKKPLGIAHSVPLGVPGLCGPLNFNRLEAPVPNSQTNPIRKFVNIWIFEYLNLFAFPANLLTFFLFFYFFYFENLNLPFFALVSTARRFYFILFFFWFVLSVSHEMGSS